MSQEKFTVGDVVSATYKSGKYIGELTEIKPPKAVIRVLAVLKHPKQGDLHHPGQAHVPMFHQRKALSFREYALVQLSTVSRYTGAVPEYGESLRTAVDNDIAALRQEPSTPFKEQSIAHLKQLKKDYF